MSGSRGKADFFILPGLHEVFGHWRSELCLTLWDHSHTRTSEPYPLMPECLIQLYSYGTIVHSELFEEYETIIVSSDGELQDLAV